MKKLILVALLLPLLSFGQKPGLLHFGIKTGFGFTIPMNSVIQTDTTITQEYLPGYSYGGRFGIGKRVQFFTDLIYLNEKNSYRQIHDSISSGKVVTSKYYEVSSGLRLRISNYIMEGGVALNKLISSNEVITNLDDGELTKEDITKKLSDQHYRVFVTVGQRLVNKPEISLCLRGDFTFTPTSMNGFPYNTLKTGRYVYTGSAFFILQLML